MASFNKFESFVGLLGTEGHQLNTDTLQVYLTNTAPSAASDSVKTDLAEISAGNGYSAGGQDISAGYSEASGTGTLTGSDVTWTASGGAINQFQYVVLYNATAASDPLIGWWDYGSAVDLADGESFTVDFGASILTIA